MTFIASPDGRPWHPGPPGPVDLSNCDAEPIHIPGSVQPFGALVAFDEATREVLVVSRNLEDHLAISPTIALRRSIDDVLGGAAAAVDDALAALGPGPLDVDGGAGPVPFVGAVFRSGGLAVVEVEPRHEVDDPLGTLWRATVAQHGASSVAAAADAAARAVREITGFDRVMVYRFDRDWNGEVIAEARDEQLRTFLGLRYPATDIPAQARALYERNLLRFIGDVEYEPVPLLIGDRAAPWPLDLSDSMLRSVSPIHIEYLSHMGVSASMSVSLLSEGRLWGLIACHHYRGPLVPPAAARAAALHVAQILALRVHDLANAERRSRSLDLFAISDDLAQDFAGAGHRRITNVFGSRGSDIVKLTGATGLLARFGAVDAVRLGTTPGAHVVDAVLERIGDGAETQWSSDRLGDDLGLATTDGVAGALALSLSGDRDDVLVWFRPEVVEVVDWAGDPYAKERAAEAPGVRLSPRRSFDTWREIVRGHSAPWEAPELAAAHRFGRQVSGALRRRDRDAHALASDLQVIMQPDHLPSLRGVSLDAHYRPDGSGRVGGDWYDAFEVDGRLVLVVGDVAGHGLEAAAVMTQARNAARAHLYDRPEPAAVLSRLASFVHRALPREMLTVLIGVLDVDAGELRWASAGHLMPRARRADGRVHRVDGVVGPVLGASVREYVENRSPVDEGDVLVLFSDGLVERRRRSLDAGIQLLEQTMARLGAVPSMAGYCDRLAGLVTDDETEDDVTLLAMRRDPVAPPAARAARPS